MSGEYNLLDEKWIPVIWHTGKYERLGILDVLRDAHRIRDIAASNPMDRVAVIRFLLALLYWCKGNPPEDRGHFTLTSLPMEWFAKLEKSRDCFNLLGDGERFYQWKRDGDKKLSANYLIQEIPTGTNFWHFRHSTEGQDGLCPACCAMGLLRLPVFATSGGRGKPPGINGKPPIYVIPLGSSLYETLLLSWRKVSNCNFSTPAWEDPAMKLPEKGEVPLLTGLTWLPRRVWLDNPKQPKANCISCGRKEHLARQCVFASIGSSQLVTKIKLKELSLNVKIPDKMKKRIFYDKGDLVLKGSLSEKERDILLKLSDDESFQEVVNCLFDNQHRREWKDPHVIHNDSEVINSADALGSPDAAAGQWVEITVGVLQGQKAGDKGRFWIVGFSTVQNDKYLEAIEGEIFCPCALEDENVQMATKKINMWQKKRIDQQKILRKILRSKVAASAAITSVRPHVEDKVADRTREMLAGKEQTWEQASDEYNPLMAAVAKSFSPGFTSAAVQRREKIARVKPNMLQQTDLAKNAQKKGGDK